MAPSVSSPSYELLQFLARRVSALHHQRRSERGACWTSFVVFAAGLLLPSVVDTQAATSCHQRKRRANLITRGHREMATARPRLHRLHRPGDGTSDETGLVRSVSNFVFHRLTPGRVAAPLPLSSSGNSFRRPTSDAGSRRSCAPGPPWPASPAPFGDIHSPALQRRESRHARQKDVGRLIERGAHHFVADAG